MATKKIGRRKILTSRFSLRIPSDLNKDLRALGRFEKRAMAKLVRTCITDALERWHKKHPGVSSFKNFKYGNLKCK